MLNKVLVLQPQHKRDRTTPRHVDSQLDLKLETANFISDITSCASVAALATACADRS